MYANDGAPSAAQPESSIMKLRAIHLSFALIVGASSLSACSSPAEVACEKVKECGLFGSSDTLEECVKEVEEELSPGQLEECAECVEEASCSNLHDKSCSKACGDD